MTQNKHDVHAFELGFMLATTAMTQAIIDSKLDADTKMHLLRVSLRQLDKLGKVAK